MDIYEKTVAAFIDLVSDKISLPPSPLPSLEKHPFAQEGRNILFPFLGELGLEVRGFLGQIEPWLRSGWIIPARRPSLYAKLGAFEDPVFFARVEEIKREFGLYEVFGRLTLNKSIPLTLASGQIGQEFHYNTSANLEADLKPALAAQRELRSAFFDRYGHEQLAPTEWHLQLSRQSLVGDDLYYCSRHATIPSYLPDLFVHPPFDFYPHIGIQLRNVPYNPHRNSDPQRMSRLAALASQLLDLPVLIYGKPTDDTLAGYTRTIDYAPPGTPPLNAELVFLKNCRLMISPDSGWADLMGWLRVPTLLERQQFLGGFEALRPFRPRILLADENRGVAETISILCNGDENTTFLPDPDQGEDQGNSFLRPLGEECKEFWRKYRGQ